jgi:hypothetical protein
MENTHKRDNQGSERDDLGDIKVAETSHDERLLLVNETLCLLERNQPESVQIINLEFFAASIKTKASGPPHITGKVIHHTQSRICKRAQTGWNRDEARISKSKPIPCTAAAIF